ncbi:hypothetical protein [Streptomyces sp. f150]|uniref:hypothetical protein n=1 Tax=Streptomyces sp. f150 TaxID=1827699 RepID=UPI0015CF4115|nr:hypothetical protein [Streptomyces sp. f150]
MHWYEDDALRPDFASTPHLPAPGESTAALVVSSSLVDFPPGIRSLNLCRGPGLSVVVHKARGNELRGCDQHADRLIVRGRRR